MRAAGASSQGQDHGDTGEEENTAGFSKTVKAELIGMAQLLCVLSG